MRTPTLTAAAVLGWAVASGGAAPGRDAGIFFAHRGLSTFAPENTLLAFRVARERGFGKVELDVRTTRDDQIIVFHDETLARAFGDPRQVCEVTFDEVRSRELGTFFLREILRLPEGVLPRLREVGDPWVEALFATRISTLEEVFATFGTGLEYHLDVKRFGCATPTPLMITRLVKVIERFGLEGHVWVESTDLNVLMQVRLLNARIRALLWRDRIFEESDEFLDMLRALGITSVDAFVGGVDKSKRHRLRGFKVHTFTVNSLAQVAELSAAVDYFITDIDAVAREPLDPYRFFNTRARDVQLHSDRSALPAAGFVLLTDAPPFVLVREARGTPAAAKAPQ